jgi:hypothetical protein
MKTKGNCNGRHNMVWHEELSFKLTKLPTQGEEHQKRENSRLNKRIEEKKLPFQRA